MNININDIKQNHYTESGFKQFDPIIGNHTEYLYKVLKNKGWENKAIKDQLGKALEILSFCNPSYATRNQATQGLVMGRVQSGKTTSFSMVSSLAADNGYKIIIQLLGTTNLLVDDNFNDVKQVLGLESDSLNYNLDWWWPLQVKAGHNNGVDYSTHEIVNALGNNKGLLDQNRTSKVVYIYCIKKTSQIEKLTKLVSKIKKQTKSSNLPILIIDDEVDSYSLNTKKDPLESSPTYDSLEKLKKTCGEVSYIGYTATSQALFLAHDNSFLRPEAYAVLEPGSAYVGNSHIFGETSHILTSQQRSNPGLNRHQSKTIDPMDHNGKLNRKGEPVDYDMKKLKQSLRKPILDFLISWSFNWIRVDENPDLTNDQKIKQKVMSMMLMPATTSRISNFTPTQLMSWVQPEVEDELNVIKAYLSSPTSSNTLNQAFKDIFNDKLSHCPKNVSKPTMKMSKDLIKELLKDHKYQCATVKQGGTTKIKATNAYAWFIIGGMKLSRGYVVPNLVTTWMPFQPSSLVFDTTEQRGRFFGYKESYKDLISVYAQENTIDLLKLYSSIENHLFESVKIGAKKGLPFSSADTNWVLFDSLFSLTSTAKNRTKLLKKVTSTWHTSLHSPFINNNGIIKRNNPFNNDIEFFLQNLNMKKIKDKKYGITIGSAQEALHIKLKLDDVYNLLLDQLNQYSIHKNDATLKAIIQSIKTTYLNKNWHCDIVYFANIKNRSLSKYSNKNVGWFFPNSGYKSGPSQAKRQVGYVGDDYLIVGNNNFDPRNLNFDKDNNENFTIQIHKIKNIKDSQSNTILNNIYTIRIHAPWDRINSYYIGH